MLTLGSKLAVVEGGCVYGDEVVVELEPGLSITSQCDTVGGGNGSHTLSNHVTGNGRST